MELELLHPPAINRTQPISTPEMLVLKADHAERLSMVFQLLATQLLLTILLFGNNTSTSSWKNNK